MDKLKLAEYKAILLRIERAGIYFSKLSDSQINEIESTKEYKLLSELIYKANDLYMELKSEEVEL